jgi:hypothetical protein
MPDYPASPTSGSGGDAQEPREVEKPLGGISSGGKEEVEPEPFFDQEVQPDQQVQPAR